MPVDISVFFSHKKISEISVCGMQKAPSVR